MKRIAQLTVLVLTLIFLVSQPLSAAGPWEGRVVDIETKEPLEDTVVVAIWQRAWRTPAGDNPYVYEVKEALSDKEGSFIIPSYTPINLLPLVSYMKGPYFIIYKPGYLSIEWHHERYFLNSTAEKVAELSGIGEKMYRISTGLIELPKLTTREDRIHATHILPGTANYQEYPLLYKAINEEYQRFGLDEIR